MSTFASASRVWLARVAPFDARAAAGGARASRPSSPVAAVGNRLSQRVALAGSARLAPQTRASAPRPRRSRRAPLRTLALVNVDLGPAAVLGASVMTSAIALYQVRASRPEVSRDQDVFFSSVGLLCGGILVFQGWRLDPLMLFGQLLTAGTAVAFASEAIGLRQEILNRELAEEEDVIAGLSGGYGRANSGRRRGARGGGSRGGGPGPGAGGAPFAPLPPPRARMQFDQSYDDYDSSLNSSGWDARRTQSSTPWGREQLGGDEFVYDAGSSYEGERRGRRVGGEAPPRRGGGGGETGGGYMDGFQEGRGGAPPGGGVVRRESRDASGGSVGGGSKYDDSFGPGRFGDDNDDWEL